MRNGQVVALRAHANRITRLSLCRPRAMGQAVSPRPPISHQTVGLLPKLGAARSCRLGRRVAVCVCGGRIVPPRSRIHRALVVCPLRVAVSPALCGSESPGLPCRSLALLSGVASSLRADVLRIAAPGGIQLCKPLRFTPPDASLRKHRRLTQQPCSRGGGLLSSRVLKEASAQASYRPGARPDRAIAVRRPFLVHDAPTSARNGA